MTRDLTIDGVPEEIYAALEGVSRERGQSVGATARQILVEAVSPAWRLERLKRYITWDESDLATVSEALAAQKTWRSAGSRGLTFRA